MHLSLFRRFLRRLYFPALGVILLLLPSCAQSTDADGNSSPVIPGLAKFWMTMGVPIKAVVTVGSTLVFFWLIGGLMLGYLLFSLNVAAMSAVRWGIFLSVLLWLGFVFWFRWFILLDHNLLPFLLLTAVTLLVSVLFLFLILRTPTPRTVQ